MSNNRLYIGNKKTKEYIFIEKGWGSGWTGDWFDADALKEFLQEQFEEGSEQKDTDLVFFTEQSDMYADFIDNGFKFTKSPKIT